MTKEQNQIKEFMELAGQKGPDKPTAPDEQTRILRVKLLLEEVFELAKASGVEIRDANDENFSPIKSEDLCLSNGGSIDLVEVADALADIKYVGEGCAVAWGIDLEPVFEEVHSSNMTKFIDGYRREDNKWMKGKSYRPPNLLPIIEAQKNEGN